MVTPTSSPLASTGRSLLSRLALPLKSRTPRNLTDFHIRLLEPHRQYSPGDLVEGAVVLTVVKPIRLTHLTVCLHGFVRVFKHANGANEPLPINAGLTASSNPKKSQYFGNGHASLFQDEVTLCGEGRLEAGIYEFKFELDFPKKDLPTSIDFERGTISYMVTSTITRPTSIAATSSCEQKVSLVETVDIGPLNPQKPRTISLEPISRRTRRRRAAMAKEAGSQVGAEIGARTESFAMPGSPLPDESASQCGSADHSNKPRSPVPSEIVSTVSAATGTESTTSSSTGHSFRLGPVPSSTKLGRDSQRVKSSSFAENTITATIELMKAGCLPGDNLPLKISIKHTKVIKSLHGIIITLYRQGRIDSAPPLSLFVDPKGKAAEKMKHEEYYPKSKTGLGGLSLSSAGSSSLFRKDLAQTFAPILINPSTLTTEVTASVRVPEDVFPTISQVPGQMISFKYHVEVLLDLGAKLAGQQRHLPRVGTVTLPSNYGSSGGFRGDGNPNMVSAWGGSIVDTDHVRREKSVAVCVFEIVVGTTDSARKRGRGNTSSTRQMNDWPEQNPGTPSSTRNDPVHEEPFGPTDTLGNLDGDDQTPYQYLERNYRDQYPTYYTSEEYVHQQTYNPYQDQYEPPTRSQIPIPPPDFLGEDGLSEKDRTRLAEQRLLPSQPPLQVQGPSTSSAMSPLASPAPTDELDEDLYSAEDATPVATTTVARLPVFSGNFLEFSAEPSAPTLEDLGPHAVASPSEDKQELERQRMLAEASAPSNLIADEEDNGGESSSGAQHEPSAPSLVDGETYGGQYLDDNLTGSSLHHESLPRYER